MTARLRGLRGATTVERDEPALLHHATRELLAELLTRNALTTDQVVSALFTVTPDLRSDFPARAAREAGWDDVPLLCTTEIDVPNALPNCIRVLLHVESSAERSALHHVYLRGAAGLRPDLAG
ncbi:MAG: chorismate mutase [Gemmatimonadetes bacterium]|nr:chorismate mutase [Gemmatimonadota bacterium]